MIFNIHKPIGMSSFDVVRALRRKLNRRSIGHAGTLDPFAEGVLVVGVDEGTKLLPYLQAEDKEYIATLKLGVETDSLDKDGEVTGTCAVSMPDVEVVQNMLNEFVGIKMQEVPKVSAIKIDGERAYAKARRDEVFEMPSKEVVLHSATVLETSQDEGTVTFHARTGKGYYVRALGRDLARSLGTVGHLTTLSRTRSGGFQLPNAVTLDEVKMDHGVPLLKAVSCYPMQELTDDETREIRQGKKHILAKHVADAIALHHREKLVAMAKNTDGKLKVLRGFSE